MNLTEKIASRFKIHHSQQKLFCFYQGDKIPQKFRSHLQTVGVDEASSVLSTHNSVHLALSAQLTFSDTRVHMQETKALVIILNILRATTRNCRPVEQALDVCTPGFNRHINLLYFLLNRSQLPSKNKYVSQQRYELVTRLWRRESLLRTLRRHAGYMYSL
jgi:hypothetical protein